jgi:caulimovirus viroplasmin
MAGNLKWYVVWVGNAPGVYNSWEECKIQVENYPGARYKSFDSQEKAIMAFRGNKDDEMKILRNIATAASNPGVSYESDPGILKDSLAVDAACSGNPGKMEYRGVYVKTGEEVFKKGPFINGTNNIGEFLALVHGLALLKQKGSTMPLYSDSRTAISWVRDKKCKTKLMETEENHELFSIVRRAEDWLKNNTFTTRIIKWETDKWGEIPADFGRK